MRLQHHHDAVDQNAEEDENFEGFGGGNFRRRETEEVVRRKDEESARSG